MIDLLQNPILSGIGSIASIASLLIYLYLERDRFFSKQVDSIGRMIDIRLLKSFVHLGTVMGLLLNFSALLQTLSFTIIEMPVFWWIGRVIFYPTILLSCAFAFVEWAHFFALDLRDCISEAFEKLAYSVSFAVPVVVWTLFFLWLQPNIDDAYVSSLMSLVEFADHNFR